MAEIFKIVEKTGREIYMTKERWNHILRHPEMNSLEKLEDIKKALTNPDLIVPHKFHPMKRNYYLYYKDKMRYLLVAVRYLNGTGYVSTSFMTRKIIKR